MVVPEELAELTETGSAVIVGTLVRVARHQRAFVEEVAAVGMAGPEAARLFSAELSPAMTRIRIEVESLFDQTPGPGAGARL